MLSRSRPGLDKEPVESRLKPAGKLIETMGGGGSRGSVTLATFMELLDTSIANVALPFIGGGLGPQLR
jgi:hypothetical protein